MTFRFTSTDWVLFAVAALLVVVGVMTAWRPEELALLRQPLPGAPGQTAMSRFALLSPWMIRVYGVISVVAGCGLAALVAAIPRKT